jgi:hypothetical protein
VLTGLLNLSAPLMKRSRSVPRCSTEPGTSRTTAWLDHDTCGQAEVTWSAGVTVSVLVYKLSAEAQSRSGRQSVCRCQHWERAACG